MLFILAFKSFPTDIESKTHETKYRKPGHRNKHHSLCIYIESLSAYVYKNARLRRTCMSQAERLQQQTLSAYSYPLTQFLSKEQLEVMAQMQTTQMPECVSDRTIPRPAIRRRKAAWTYILQRMATRANAH